MVRELVDRRELLTNALADFLSDGVLPERRGVPEHVAASWRRSVSHGVTPHGVATVYHPELDLDSRLARSARPEIDRLAEQVADIPSCVALTDDRARLLRRTDSGSWFGRVADRASFAQGFGYAEGFVGTNGVGTVLEFGESVHIVGAEHFVEPLHEFACAGAPIRDPFTGRIAGVVDVSCLAEHSHPLLHTLVRSTAARIERNLVTDRDHLPQVLFDAYTRLEARTRDAVVAVGPRVVMASAAMQSLLPAADHACVQDHLRYLAGRAQLDDRIDVPSGARVRLRGTTVRAGDDVAGVVAVVTVLHEVDAELAVLLPEPAADRPTGSSPRPVDSAVPAWRAATATVRRALDAGEGVLVLGERGSGRATLLTGLAAGSVVPVTAEEIEAAPESVLERGEGALLVLRDLDRLSAGAGERMRRALDELGPVARPVVAATATGELDGPLVGLFAASATVPPLRHRGADLPSLVTALLAELAPHREVRLARDAERLLARHRWPGNVAQLRAVLAAALHRRPVGVIEVTDLPADCQSVPRSALRRVDEVERDTVVAALREAGGNRKAAAVALGLARSTLYRKIRQYGITD